MNLSELNEILHAAVADTDLLYLWDGSEAGLARSKKMTVGEMKLLFAPEEPEPLPPTFESDPVAMGAVSFSVAHSLGAQPRWVQVAARCIVAENGWQIGDEVVIEGDYAPGRYIATIWSNATVVGCLLSDATIHALRRDDNSGADLNTAKWKLIFRAGL